MDKQKINAVLIGSGNAAWHLAPALRAANIHWVQVYSPTPEHASRMAEHLGGTEAGVSSTSQEDGIFPDADLYFFAVKDDALEGLSSRIAKRVAGREATAVHISGALPLQILQQDWARCGVLYAFASFRTTAPCPDLRFTP
ncbi:MAG: NAD(P)-binding domain-containing protein, partial [Bacteroidales bacterium]|nr:NAD(P)-binding domain-containing protein [Bacteroidales bacterium]